jgi:PAS domain S-box-containing protein
MKPVGQRDDLREPAATESARRVIDGIPGLVAIWSPHAGALVCNRQLVEYCGLTSYELKHWATNGTIHAEDVAAALASWAPPSAAEGISELELRLRRKDGVYLWFSCRSLLAPEPAGRFGQRYVLLTDIDARRQAEQAKSESELVARAVADSVPVGIALMAPDGTLEVINNEICDYFGKTMEELRTWGTGNEIHPDDLARVVAGTMHSLETGEPFEMEERLRRFDGVYRWFHVRGLPHRDAERRIVRWYVVHTDIDDRKRAEEALRIRERELDQIVNAIPALAWAARPDGTAEFLNQYYVDYVGCSLSKLKQIGWGAAVHPDDLPVLAEIWDSAASRGADVEGEARLRRADGEYRWFLFRASALRDDRGNVVKWYGVSTDIEDFKKAEAGIKRSETLLVVGQQLSLIGTFSWRLDTDELAFSEELYRIFELELGTAVTHARIAERIHPEDLSILARSLEGVKTANPDCTDWYATGDIRLKMPDGAIKYIQSKGRMIRQPEGWSEYVGAMQDVTQRRLAEGALDQVRSELAHAARAMTLGVLTASIAHELNQPLAGIIANANTCQRMLGAEPPNVQGALETARRSARDGHRAADVITRLRALFGSKQLATEAVDLNHATREVLALCAHELQRREVVVSLSLGQELPRVLGDRVQLQQVILNLVINACDAMQNVSERPREIQIESAHDADGAVRLTVRDAGVGVAAEALEKLFDSFFTTKPNGMGIGLSVSRSIIERHKGRLWVAHNDGPGAAFSFSIPPGAVDAE